MKSNHVSIKDINFKNKTYLKHCQVERKWGTFHERTAALTKAPHSIGFLHMEDKAVISLMTKEQACRHPYNGLIPVPVCMRQ